MKNVMQPRSRMERIGFWVVVAAAGLVLLALAGWLLPAVFRAASTALVLAGFVAFLTALNSRMLADGVNAVLGRQVFPLVQANERAIRRMIQVNAVLTFVFAFVYALLPFGPIVSALLMVGALALAVVVLRRMRASNRIVHTTYSTTDPQDRAA